MGLNRRSFLGGLLAAPVIVRAESLMKIWVPRDASELVWVGVDYGDVRGDSTTWVVHPWQRDILNAIEYRRGLKPDSVLHFCESLALK